ncbi:ribonuclease HI family protein [Patescibacteria group bacterium]|nr:ribonuclease HI family protein [Patescibacteria group bacterium]
MKNILIFTDGGARGNPGPAGIGVYAEDENGKELISIGEKIGVATNNTAEYLAIVRALEWLCSQKNKIEKNAKVTIFVDSQLAYSQLVGLYKVKNENIRKLVFMVREKEALLEIGVSYFQIPREKNKKADALVNLALDNKI